VAFYPVPIDPEKRGWDSEDIDDSNNGQNIDDAVSIHETWQGMQDVLRKGLVRRIGVSNMPLMLLHELMSGSSQAVFVPPTVNQVEMHPYLQQSKLLTYCQRRGVHVQAYSPLGTPGFKGANEPVVLDDPVVQSIAKAHAVTPAQICLAWALQRGTTVVVKSVDPQHQRDNLIATTSTDTLVQIKLTDEEMTAITSLDRGYRFFRPEDWWGDKAMAVFA
jgi:alcohol dehydrogenase (NADP+)